MKKAKIHFTVLDAVLITLLAATAVFLIHRVGVEMHYRWQWPVILQYIIRRSEDTWVAGALLQGFLTTIKLSLWATVLATLLGTIMGILRVSHGLFARLVAGSYVETIRNLPPLVLVFIVYFFIGERIMTLIGLDELRSCGLAGDAGGSGVPVRPAGAPLRFLRGARDAHPVRGGLHHRNRPGRRPVRGEGTVGGRPRPGVEPVAAGALCHPAAGHPEDPAGPGRPAHLDDQGLGHRLGHLHPGAYLPGA